MKRKNIIKIPLNPEQRLTIWSAVDLLRYLSGNDAPKFSDQVIDSVCNSFESVDGDPETYEFDFTAAHHRLCSYALKYAELYLDGDFRHFRMPISERIDSELKEFATLLRELRDLFPC